MSAWLAVFAVAALGSDADEAQRAELVRVRAEVAGQVQLSAYDLVDEMVYQWRQDPVFDKPTNVVLASVTVPVGLGTGLQALLENHLNAVISEYPATNVQLVHCPRCTAVNVHSGPEGTVVSRGIDNPRLVEELGEDGKHALFVDVEAEGSWLVLRARLTRLTPDLPIVWSYTQSSSGATPSLLRQSSSLKSAQEAREEYLRTLRNRGAVHVPLTIAIRSYARPQDGPGTPPPPFLWLQTGVELSTHDARAWTAGLVFGYSFIPQAYQGVMVQGRVNRLITGRARSLTRPDLYGYFGAAAISVWGDATAPFQQQVLTADELLNTNDGNSPRFTFGTLQFGLDLRFGNRIGVSAYLETLPDYANSQNLGRYVQFVFAFQTLGTEVSFWF